ncbi:MAG TPA: cbb3-type cytochrome oxidase assembly protein CcoS [Hyphomicrobiales bacterium]|nr:cbb3-type cytochrome oxidase assembly protein CcoS [Kaistiaceae bacterium]HQF30925.1 cbb3-type cytochrome oxidase assembly protein CcoS [Hyphomicrobiales bacterium]
MNILLLTIPVALALGLIFLVLFMWALKTGQFEDLDGAAHRVLLNDDVEDEDNETKPDFLKE